ncbi:hypothetical protein [Seonamhaeicola marinus]|uniref:Lipoprotein n=1 Tax=Seonamhaeicola marinus TaxID=1912246 RepID=A0A5D0HSY0_9FLAO|nr:hypothetical protein [Seonamhaeicola marinus]TYA74426.1 hypothetical protein FUA24_13965 [Seonamhaeicola marinus]
MKKFLLSLSLVTLFLISGCSQAEALKDTLDATECLAKLTRLSNNDDDYTCKEQVAELKSLRKSCRSLDDDGQIQALIDLLEASEDCLNDN